VETPEREPGSAIAHVPGLDGLRGVAILLVVTHHFGMFAGFSREGQGVVGFVLTRLLDLGWAGVDLFFVLSGFLITSILLASRHETTYFSAFYGRRILRIFPLYFGALFLGLVVLPAITAGAASYLGQAREHSIWLWTYTSNIALALGTVATFGAFDMFWTLAIEEQFYLTWPLLVKLARPRVLVGIGVGLVVGALVLRCAWLAAGGTWIAPYRFTLTRVDDLALGALVAIIVRHAPGREAARRWAPRVLAASLLVLGAMFWAISDFYPQTTLVVTLGETVLGVLFASTILLVACGERRGLAWLERPGLRAWGRISYGIYVWHWPLVLALEGAHRLEPVPPTAAAQLLRAAGFLLVGIAGSYILGWLSYHLYEIHFLRLKRYFDYARDT
jgi:peptidoglycan/LPS O-acetylase OafA/YrhL